MNDTYVDSLLMHSPLYVLAKKVGNDYEPLSITLLPDMNKETADIHYLESRMYYGIPTLTRIDWSEYHTEREKEQKKEQTIDTKMLDNILQNKTQYSLYASFTLSDNKIRRKLLYYGPCINMVNEVKEYQLEVYLRDNAIDEILAKYSGVRDFKFNEIMLEVHHQH